MKNLQNYPGAKNNSGLAEWIINNIPFHERYIEPFAGSAQVYFKKRLAEKSVLQDINVEVCQHLYNTVQDGGTFIACRPYTSLERYTLCRNDFIYFDPPYPAKARRSGAACYKHEMLADDEHVQLLTTIQDLDANIMISTSPNELYDIMLSAWRKKTFETIGRRGPRTEVIYMNYPEPLLLHDYRYLGDDYKQRQCMTRKRQKFANKFKALPPHQQHMLMQEMIKANPAAVQHFLTVNDQK